jgi:hypothetical protein
VIALTADPQRGIISGVSEPPLPPVLDATSGPPARPHRGVPLLVIGLIAVLAVVVATVFYVRTRHPDMTVHGSLVLHGDSASILRYPSGCAGQGGLNDLIPGGEVIVSDAGGRTLAIGLIIGGTPGASTTACTMTFEVDKVPSGKKFYGLTVTHRGTVQFTEAGLKAGPQLTLGS